MTDHLPLVHAFSKKTDPDSNRQQRQLSAITEYNCHLTHHPGKSNSVADALSRNVIAAAEIGLDMEKLQRLQENEGDNIRRNTSLSFAKVPSPDKKHSILCDISTGKPRPWIPKEMRKEAFKLIHNLSHPSQRSTCRLMTSKYVWENINKDCKEWAKSCQSCQTSPSTHSSLS